MLKPPVYEREALRRSLNHAAKLVNERAVKWEEEDEYTINELMDDLFMLIQMDVGSKYNELLEALRARQAELAAS